MDSVTEQALRAKLEAVMTKANLIAWLEGQDPDKGYRYTDNQNCGIAQFLKAQGFNQVGVDTIGVYDPASGKTLIRLPEGWNEAANDYDSGSGYTWGNMLKGAYEIPE